MGPRFYSGIAVGNVAVRGIPSPGASNVGPRSYGGMRVDSYRVSMNSSYVAVGSKHSLRTHGLNIPYRGVAVAGYAVLDKRNNMIVNDRVDKKIGGIAVDGYIFSKASQKVHLGSAHNHKNVMRSVHMDGVIVDGVGGRTVILGLGCDGVPTRPGDSHAPRFHGVCISNIAIHSIGAPVVIMNLPRTPVANVIVHSICVRGTGRHYIFRSYGSLILSSICISNGRVG